MRRLKLTVILLTLLLLFLSTLANATAVKKKVDEDRQLYDRARQAMSSDDKGEAIDLYKELIYKYPNSNLAGSSINQIRYYYNRFGKKWLGVNYLNSVIKRKDVPETLRAQARMGIAYLKEISLSSSTQGTFQPKQKASVNLSGRNIDEIDISIYKVTKHDIIKNIKNLRNILNIQGLNKYLVKSFKEKPEKQRNRNYFNQRVEFTLDEPGIYIFEGKTEYLVTSTVIVVTNNILVVKSDSNHTLLWLADRISGEPVEGAKVRIPIAGKVTSGVTDQDGIFDAPLDLKKYSSSIITAITGEDIAVSDAYFYRSQQRQMLYFYTDRPIYRPSQKVYFKGVLREVGDEEYLLPKDSKVQLTIRDARYKEVKKLTVDLTEHGTFSGEYNIPDEPPLGRYNVQVRYGRYTYYGYFTVQEYKKPEYFVTITPEKQAYISGDKIKVETSTEYYFGAPVPDADVAWEVYTRDYYYPWWREYRYSWYLSSQKRSYYYGYGRGNLINSGSAKTDSDGNARFEFDSGKLARDAVYTLVVKVTDKSRKVVESETTVMVTQGEFRIDVRSDKYAYKEDENVFVKISTKDFTGQPVSQLIDVEITHTGYNGKKSYSELYLKKLIETSSDGLAEFDFKVDKLGNYNIVLTGKDSRGTKITANKSVYVYNYTWNYYSNKAKGIEIKPDKEMYKPGDTANLVVTTKYADSYALITLEQRGLYEYKLIRIKGSSAVVPIELLDKYKPNVTVYVSIVRDNNFLNAQQSIIILPEDKFLTIEIIPDKDKYKPGEVASFTVKTTDNNGDPAPAEVSFALVDESIFALMSDQTLDIKQFFYGLKQNSVQTRTSFNFRFYGQTGGRKEAKAQRLAMAPAMEMEEGVASDAIGLSKAKKGVGRKDMDSSSSLVEAKVREKFKDTAFYRAVIVTDETGTAGFEVELPDNLTTWRASVKAITKDTKVGQTSKTVLVTKDLLVRLELPRFFTKRDKGTVTGIIHNYLETAKKVKVVLEVAPDSAAPIEVLDEKELWVEVGANEEKRVDWRIDAVRTGTAEITLKALTNEESDAMKLTIPVLPHGLMQHFGDAGIVEGERKITMNIPKESLNESAKLKLVFSPTVANVVTESLEYLIGYPYGCVEQTMSRFLPDIMVSKTLQNLGLELPKELGDLPDMVDKGLKRLYSMQHGDGGWGWWEQDATHPFMTAYVVYGLAQAKKADYAISPEVLRRGVSSLKSQIHEKKDIDINTKAFLAYALAYANSLDREQLDSLYGDISALNNYSLALLAESLHMAGDTVRANEALDRLRENAEDAGGRVFFKSKVKRGHGWYDSDTEATAYALKAFVKIAPKDEIIPSLVLWLANTRIGNRWYNTKDTASAVMALSEYLSISDEMDPDYNFSVKVNGTLIGNYVVTKENMFSFDGSIAVKSSYLTAGENIVTMTKEGDGRLYYSSYLKYYSNEEDIKSASTGIHIEKEIFKKEDGKWVEFTGTLKVGEQIKITLEISGAKGYEYVIIEDPKPAGCDEVIRSYEKSGARREYWWSNIDHRDEKLAVFITRMWRGKYNFEYELTAQTPGEFHIMPAKAYMMYNDDVGGNSDEFSVTIDD